ncbi:actin-like ATPase domain-containing protein [Parathielavia hyrcaniae]|uniref:Actin-like ATPase domain-containing protein n=1 Tax=Parathielavia hyrcaniae TaxID=113614 RepID=A0AAN6Q4K9_9PEZI|nr:actin-like ATPase domain-containing protein [Parathielavia hyrcaniae]
MDAAQSADAPPSNTVIIGIDFGTTYSSRMEVIASWESDLHSTSDEEKTPSAISFGTNNKVSWGYNISLYAEQVKWFKLLLIDDKDLPDDVKDSVKIKEARAYLKKHNKSANERITETVSRNLVNYSKFHIVITIPAIWPEYARVRMRNAASDAGMLGKRIAGDTELSFISEPEAAALATLSDMQGRSDLKIGDSFVVVDCGGDAVDLISYEVVSIAPMVDKECGLCGAVFVDEAFLEVLKHKFGKKSWKKMDPETRQRLVHDEWEHGIKQTFDGRERSWTIKMPFECVDIQQMKKGGGQPKVTLTAADVRAAFQPTVDKIRGMVNEQVLAVKTTNGVDPKYVIMVGGFGRCKYLLSSLKESFRDTEILQSRGSGPWAAICRGAVPHAASLRGLAPFSVEVQARIARISCIVKMSENRCPWKHDPADKYWNDDYQAWKANNQMDWLLKAV